ncbi:MAG TPA: SCO family protein [Candidatus Acidoferrales bacterium]|jgi:protein SCO1/2|nr:SCO family protein [Candidatus Acidoferrales bacterium]
MAKSTGAKKKQRNDERIFAIVAVILCLILGAAFCALLVALNYQGKQPSTAENLPDTAPALIQPDHPRELVDFSLTNSDGGIMTRRDFDGKILVVDFLFTSCSLTCPAVNGQMAQIQRLTTNDPEVKLVSLTVDPRDDTPPVLQKYRAGFGADTNRWFFLTGDKSVLYSLIGQSFLAKDTNDPVGYMPGDFAHTERIAIVDAHGQLRGFFDGLNQETAGAVVSEVNKLRHQNL